MANRWSHDPGRRHPGGPNTIREPRNLDFSGRSGVRTKRT